MGSESDEEYTRYVAARLAVLHRAAYLLCGDADRADDVVQATITGLYIHWRQARRADNLDAYVHRMLFRRFLDEKRKPWSRVMLTDTVPDSPAPRDSAVEERDAVTAALGRLPAGRRAVVVLRFLCDLSVEDTARVLGCTTGNVKSQSAHGLATLREWLRPGEPLATNCFEGTAR